MGHSTFSKIAGGGGQDRAKLFLLLAEKYADISGHSFSLPHVSRFVGGFRRLALIHMASEIGGGKRADTFAGPSCLPCVTILGRYDLSCVQLRAGMKSGILTSDRYTGRQGRDPVPRASIAPRTDKHRRSSFCAAARLTCLTKGGVSRYVLLLFGLSAAGEHFPG